MSSALGGIPGRENRTARFFTATLPIRVIYLYWLLIPVRDAVFTVIRPVTPWKYRGLLEGSGSSLRAYDKIKAGSNGWGVLLKWSRPVKLEGGQYDYPQGWA